MSDTTVTTPVVATTSNIPHIQINLSVKFRAAGITFGNWTHSQTVALPSQAALLDPFLSAPIQFFSFSQNGVTLAVSLVPPPTD